MDASMEKETFLRNWEREFDVTLRALKAYPLERQDYRPHEKSRSAKELALVFVSEERTGINGAISGVMDFSNRPNPPASMKDVLSEYEKLHKDNFNKIKKMLAEELTKTMKFPIGPKKMADLRKIDVLWFTIMDMVHHRGQLTVYIRMAGGKVPSIYGPTADYPW